MTTSPSLFRPVRQALWATVVSFGVADALRWLYTRQFEPWHVPQTQFAFAVSWGDLLRPLIWFLVGLISLPLRHWLFPAVVGAALTLSLFGPLIWSGPGDLLDAIQPLIAFRMDMIGLAVVLNSALIAYAIGKNDRR